MRRLSNPCPHPYKHPHWQGRHNLVGGYTIKPDTYVPIRCAACGAQEDNDR